MEYPANTGHENKVEYIRTCRMCGREMAPGGTRRIGVCVWCVAEEDQSINRVIPRQSYGRFDK